MTRQELKEQLQHDQFTDTVSNVVNYTSSHRQALIRYAIIAGVVLLIAAVAIWFSNYRASLRQAELQEAFSTLDAPVGASAGSGKSFSTAEDKSKASQKVLSNFVAKYSGTREGRVAQYYLGTVKAQRADNAGAEADLRAVADSSSEVSPLAKIALAQLYVGENKIAQGENLLRDLANKPTDLVNKAQAQLLLAQVLESSNPREAQKLLQSLRTPNQSPAVTRAIDQVAQQAAK